MLAHYGFPACCQAFTEPLYTNTQIQIHKLTLFEDTLGANHLVGSLLMVSLHVVRHLLSVWSCTTIVLHSIKCNTICNTILSVSASVPSAQWFSTMHKVENNFVVVVQCGVIMGLMTTSSPGLFIMVWPDLTCLTALLLNYGLPQELSHPWMPNWPPALGTLS